MSMWTILGIKPTTDIAVIKKAYAKRAAQCHIERDPKGFQELHEAYVDAMEVAKAQEKKRPKTTKEQPESKPATFRAVPDNLRKLGPTSPVDEEDLAKGKSGQSAPNAYQFHPPVDIDTKPDEQEGGYDFPKGDPTTAPLPEETPRKAGGYQFPKPGAIEAPPPHEFSPLQEEEAKNAPDYQFAKGSPASPPSPISPAQAKPLRGLPVTPPEAVIFPGILPLGDMNIPFMPLPMGSTEESFPQTKEDAERQYILDNARRNCLEDMRNLLERDAPEQAWYPMLLGADFILIQYSGKFLLELQNLCLKQLSPTMASSLYTAYGFASNKSLRKYPVAAALYSFLNKTLQLPQVDIPFLSLSEILHRSDVALGGLVRLCETCREPYVCDQALRASAFTRIQYQPYFIFKLTVFLGTNDVADVWRQALARAYAFREPPVSPCLQVLAELLPVAADPFTQTDYHPAADKLLLDEAALDDFYGVARNDMLDLLWKTRKTFPQSTRRGPWDYIFTRPEMPLIRCDGLFLAGLLDFLQEKNLPTGIWLALTDAYAGEFAGLPREEPVIQESTPTLSPEEQVTVCLMMLRHIVETPGEAPPENPSFWEIVKSMLRSI